MQLNFEIRQESDFGQSFQTHNFQLENERATLNRILHTSQGLWIVADSMRSRMRFITGFDNAGASARDLIKSEMALGGGG